MSERYVPQQEKIETIEGEKISQMYLEIIQLRAQKNLPDCPLPTGVMQILLARNGFHEELLKEIEAESQVESTAEHEMGHALVAESLGWTVRSISVVAQGSVLGVTECVPPANLSFEDWLIQSAAIALGSSAASEAVGEKPHGTGSDNAYARALASLAVESKLFESKENFLLSARSTAQSAISKVGGKSTIFKEAKTLTKAKVIA